MQKTLHILRQFIIPLIVLGGIVLFEALKWFHQDVASLVVIFATIAVGSFDMLKETVEDLMRKQFALDYIAILVIIVSIVSKEYLVAGVIVLMLSSGRTLEAYGVSQAKRALTALVSRIPSDVLLWEDGRLGEAVAISTVKIGQSIFIRKGEVIPLDGELVSDSGLADESSLTGEPYLMDKIKGDQIRSGTLNLGEGMVVLVTREEKNSTYKKIIEMVQSAQKEKAPLVRLANKYSTLFTVFTLALTAVTYLITHDIARVLAVLVIATPCPLILATPIALMGGISSAAKQRIIVKRLASLEVLSRVQAMIFDKTGTITLGRPSLISIESLSDNLSTTDVLSIAEAIERTSLHPFAKAIMAEAKKLRVPVIHARDVKEKIGYGITGVVNGKNYLMGRLQEVAGMGIEMSEDGRRVAIFHFEDTIKEESRSIVGDLKKIGLDIFVYTGDKQAAAERVVALLGHDITLKAECTPKDKLEGIKALKESGKITVMVGDGINDAPALALADVGIVFSNEEQTAASEAADIVFLGGDFYLVLTAITIAKRTIKIALQSILTGIGLSVVGMLFAAFGFIPALIGALLQELIDVAVILNALRTSR